MAISVLSCNAAALADTAPTPREFVYSYTFESDRRDEAEHAYGVDKMDPGSGGTYFNRRRAGHINYESPSSGGPQRRSGTLKIEVVREEPDGGLVLNVIENPANASDPAITCVAFGDTTVICDPNREVGPEIPLLVSLLGKGFVDPARLDAARHWRILPQGAYGTTADYRIVRTQALLLDIEESGVRSEKNSTSKTVISASIEYDTARSVPTALTESTVLRNQRGMIFETIATHATFALQSDSGK